MTESFCGAQRASGRQVASGAISAAVQSALERLPDPVDSSTREGESIFQNLQLSGQ